MQGEGTKPMKPESPDRRDFIGKLLKGLGIVALFEGAWIGTSFLKSSKATAKESMEIVAGAIDDFEPGTATAFPQGKFYLVRLDDGGVLALSRECTHLGCSLPGLDEENRFVCPCHGSIFNLKGEVLTPPATRPLDLLQVTIENKIVSVDPSTRTRRSSFDHNQVAYA